MDENTFWIKLWAIIAAMVIAVAICITVGISYNTYKFTEGGYINQESIGSQSFKWVLPDKK